MKIQPLSNNVVIKPLEKETMTQSGIVLPDTAKEKPNQGEIIAVGKGKINEQGSLIPMSVKEGDTVLFREYGFNEIKMDGQEYLIGSEDGILGVVNS